MIVLEINYAKKLGLPGYSSHQYSISIRTELTDLSQVETESTRIYNLLQGAVDKDIKNVGFIPEPTYGNGNGRSANGHSANGGHHNGASNGHANGHQQPRRTPLDTWTCTEGQRGFILRIINENNISKMDTEDLSNQLFGLGVKQINKMQASQLIEELLAKAGQPARQSRWHQQPATQPA